MLEVKVLSKKQCLAIAEIMKHPGSTEDEKLFYLPEQVFGRTLDVDCCTGNFRCYDATDNKLGWEIPAYFCETVSIKVHHKE